MPSCHAQVLEVREQVLVGAIDEVAEDVHRPVAHSGRQLDAGDDGDRGPLSRGQCGRDAVDGVVVGKGDGVHFSLPSVAALVEHRDIQDDALRLLPVERLVEPSDATMKTLGFGGFHVAGVVFGESVCIALIGGLLGIALTFPAAHWIETELSQFFPVFHITRETIILDLLAALTVGGVAGIFPTWRGATIKVAEGLRRIG